MSEWKNFCLGDVCNFSKDKVEVSKLGLGNYISTENLLPNKGGITEAASLPKVSTTISFDVGDILISNIRPYFKKIWRATFSGGCSNDVLVIRAKKNVEPKFLYYVLSEDKFFDLVTATAKGTKMPRGDKQVIMNYLVPNFPLEMQKKIAAVLSALDDKIELNNAINKNLEEQAQTIYEKICWRAKLAPLSELIEAVESGSRPKGGATTSGIPSIGAEKIDGFGRYDYSNEKFIDTDYFKRLKRGIVFSGDVMLYKDGAYTGKASMALDGFPHKTCAVNEHVFLLRTKDNMAQFFLYFTLRNEDIYKKIHALACGKAAQPGLNRQELMCVTSFLPDEEVIQKFEAMVSPLMHAIALNALENKKLGEIRDALLPRLMSGEIDVSVVEI